MQTVTSALVPGFPSRLNVIHDRDKAEYSYKLMNEYKDGSLEIITESP